MINVPRFSDKEGLAAFVVDNGFRILNLCHIPEDGRLKTLSFAVTGKEKVLEVLEFGERVDGSSLFSFIEPGKSDIYIVPRIEKVFVNPFASVPTLNVFCDYLDENGKALDVAPRNVLAKAEKGLNESAGVVLKAFAELEYYVVAKQDCGTSLVETADKNYHESAPFARFEALRNEALVVLAEAGICTKYAHSEVGRILAKDGSMLEQHEIELAPQSLAGMADDVAIAKWILRNLSIKHGVSVTFVPKVSLDH
ncbi:MAG: glutamine synthetase beta-grasp domain-containing protein, partial [Chloroflexota bacterium]